ncbi:MAG TPA: DUF6677 family protein [Terriglobia bacterium]|nr:DUF6677 family protein [Terriglobia bacterium]
MPKNPAEVAEKNREENQPKSEPGALKPSTATLVRLCVAGWLIPGAGHFLLGRRGRALIFFATIVVMFLFGLAMKGEFYATGTGSYLETLGYFGELCVGLLMPIANFFGYAGDPFFVSSDFGTAFLVTAGMLNVLTIIDAYDIAMGRKP